MNLDTLKEFLAVAECGSFEKAADALFATQSSLSKHIKKLEVELNVELFDRSARKIRLTRAGELLLPYAQKLLTLQDQCLESLHAYSVNAQYTLNIGSVYDINAYQISDLVAAFQRQNPSIYLNISCEGPVFVLQHLMNGTYDLAFLRYAPTDDIRQLSVVPFIDDKLVAVCNLSHPLAKREVINLGELANEKLLGFPPNTFMKGFMEAACRDAGFQPSISLVAQRTENHMALASRGLGISLIFERPVRNSPMQNTAVLNIDPAYRCKIDLCHVKDRKPSPAAQKFIQFVRSRGLQFTGGPRTLAGDGATALCLAADQS